MCSLVMSPFSRDYMKTEIDQIKYQQCFNPFTHAQHSHSTWFLDGRTSILVSIAVISQIESIDSGWAGGGWDWRWGAEGGLRQIFRQKQQVTYAKFWRGETLAKSLHLCIWTVKLWRMSKFSITFQCIDNVWMRKLANQRTIA